MKYDKKNLLLTITTLAVMISSCNPSDQSQIQTLMAPAVETAGAEAEKYAKTQAVGIGQTAIAASGTEIVNLKETAVVAANTQVSSVLTPQPPNIEYKINKRNIVLYNVLREISVSEATFKFSIPSEQKLS